MHKWLSGILAVLFIFSSISCEKDDPLPEEEEQTVSDDILQINNWVLENMNAFYLWNDFIPEGLNPKVEEDPGELFYKMLYEEEDKWSWITSDFNSLLMELQGTPVSFGYYPSFFSNSAGEVFISIQYVYEGSPADEAGLKRGDLIYSIDRQVMDTDNFSDVYYEDQTEHSYILGKLEFSQVLPTTDTVDITARQIDADPILHYEVLDINGTKTGYLVYAEFISGVDDKYLRKLDDVFGVFKTEGVTELIVDFRYNPGGEINTATYLASAIAPKTNMEARDDLVVYNFNDDLQDYYTENYGSESTYLKKKFVQNDYNLNLNKVYFFTTKRTASASELVITGLEPYMDVTVIGEITVGKYTGAWVIPDLNDPPQHSYAMLPIVLKYSNADGLTEFKDGLTPDHEIQYDPIRVYNFGSTEDPMMVKAIELLGGATPAKKATHVMPDINILKDKNRTWKENAFDKIFSEKSFSY